MNVNMRQIEERLADVDWKSAGGEGIDKLTQPMFVGAKAEAEYDARSRVVSAWCQAGFIVSLLALVSNGRPWGMTVACLLMSTAMIVASVRSYRARKALQQAREATYQVADDLAAQHPRDLPEASQADEPAA